MLRHINVDEGFGTDAQADKAGSDAAQIRAYLSGRARGFSLGTCGGEDREEGVCLHRGRERRDVDECEATAIEGRGLEAFVRQAHRVWARQAWLGNIHLSAR